MKSRSYFYCGWTTTLNVIAYALSRGRFIWLEGRITRSGFFHNWARRYRYHPQVRKPTSEPEIINIIRDSESIRLCGAGHSFNSGVESDSVLVSLDGYTGIVSEDLAKKQVTFRAGTRLREVIQLLLEKDLAFKALPSHNAQSIGGLLATDVHGTGKDWGWISELVVRLKVIDGKGEVHIVEPTDPLFRASVGGLGAVGIISEVTVQARDRFNVEQTFVRADLGEVEDNLEKIIQDNEHVSLYIFPFTNMCQVNRWNQKDKRQSTLGPLREFINISLDALVSAWVGNLLAYTGALKVASPHIYRFKKGSNLVLESAEAYSRTIYPLHQEQEFTVPFEDTIDVYREFRTKFEKMYESNPKKLPFSFIEVRFTPANHELGMIGPGRDRPSAWIDLICNDSRRFETYYSVTEDMIREMRARPHLGKFCEKLDKADLANVYGTHFERFLELRNEHDPNRKFINPFTRRLFGD